MPEKNKTQRTLSLFVFESICASEESIKIEIIIFQVNDDSISFKTEELSGLREVLRISIGKHVDILSDEDLNDFGVTMLRLTAIVLKSKHPQKRLKK
jgi:hypothetical protein